MANLKNKPSHPVYQTELRFVSSIDSLDTTKLSSFGYYRGFPCPHGHTIRDSTHHWCYHCVMKIKSNVCGFDVNYLDVNYKQSYYKLWKKIEVLHPDDCWPIRDDDDKTPQRISLPSYRNHSITDKKDNVNVHKAIYQVAWGDVGTMVVTRTCKKLNCGNPLHMVSSWNRLYPPSKLAFFDVEFNAKKLMQYTQCCMNNTVNALLKSQYTNTIKHPLEAPAAPYYSEEQ